MLHAQRKIQLLLFSKEEMKHLRAVLYQEPCAVGVDGLFMRQLKQLSGNSAQGLRMMRTIPAAMAALDTVHL